MLGRSNMRMRFAVLALLSSAIVVVSSPASALAHRQHGPRHNHGLTINATPNPIIAGESVLIYGQLNGSNPSGQTIRLYHRVNPSHVFTLIGSTTTDALGFYEFTRPDGIVTTNRSWFVRAPALPGKVHSRTVDERVAALVSLTASTPPSVSGYDTNHPILFTGHVYPDHQFERVYLQEQTGVNGDDWKTLETGLLGPGSNYAIKYRFRRPGAHDVRVLFRSDARNIAGVSDTVTVAIQQAQVADFTINTSAPIIDDGILGDDQRHPGSSGHDNTRSGRQRHPVGSRGRPELPYDRTARRHRRRRELPLHRQPDRQHRLPGADHVQSAPDAPQRSTVRRRQ